MGNIFSMCEKCIEDDYHEWSLRSGVSNPMPPKTCVTMFTNTNKKYSNYSSDDSLLYSTETSNEDEHSLGWDFDENEK